MTSAPRPEPLARHYRRWLGSLAGAIAAVMAASMLGFVLLPMAEQSADDLAGLMLLSARTWGELPPQARPAFETELRRQHQLALTAVPAAATSEPARLHGFYVGFLERALQARGAGAAHLTIGAGPDGDDWLWSALSAGGQPIRVGFPRERLNTHPFWALGIVFAAGLLLVVGAAAWLAERIARPVSLLERAAAQLAQGADPTLLPETGPREMAELAGHFNQMARQMHELIDARTTLLAGISHDLRTPLARMRLALDMLTLKPDPALIARLERDIDEMNTLIGQLLTLARGLSTESRQSLDLASWLHERAQLHERSMDHPIGVTCPADLQVRVAPGILARVLDNLLANALRYAPGSVDIVARRFPGQPGGSVVRVSVSDRGPGIPDDQMALTWRPFHRLEGSRSPLTGGHGLGLAVVRQLALAQGWQAGMAARDGGGLEVWVDIADTDGR